MVPDTGLPYQLIRVATTSTTGSPVGNSILSAPFVALARPDGRYDARGEERLEALVAAALMGLWVTTQEANTVVCTSP